jgi:hypothetical protein
LSTEADPPLPAVAGAGLLVGLSMLAVSVVGQWRLSVVSVTVALALALGIGVVLCRRLGLCAFERPALALLPFVLLPALAALAPPHTWDEVAYGAALPQGYAQAGRFFYNGDYGLISAFPANFEALTSASLVLFASPVPAQLLTVGLAFGLGLIAFELGRGLGLGTPVSLVAGLLVLSSRSLQTIVGVLKNDTANAFFQCLFVLMLMRYRERPRRATILLAGFFLGTAVGVKYSSLQFAVCAFLLVLGLAMRARSGGRDVLAFALCAGAVASPWYLRNLWVLGNPLFPFYNQLLHAENGYTAEYAAVADEMIRAVPSYCWATGTLREFLEAVTYGFGVLPMLLMLPGLVLALVPERRGRFGPLATLLLGYGALTLFIGFWSPRYFLCLLVVAAVLGALALERAAQALAAGRSGRARAWLLSPVVVGTAAIVLSREIEIQAPIVRDLWRLDRRAFLETHVGFWELADWLNHNSRRDDRIGIGVNAQPFYYLERSYFHIHPVSEKGDLLGATSPDDFLKRFRELGITMLVIHRWNYDRRALPPDGAPHLQAYLKRLYSSVNALRKERRIELVATVSGANVYRVPERD